ncbi:tyrosine-type recombinase/integrase [Microbispora rosea]|uniref:tyrosine-type recombinase/integrase n=1 Tax=Microbispora rosea TaxID=58117 RepID=UPI00342C7A4A
MERQIDGVVLHGKVVPLGDDLPVPGTPLEYLTAEAAALIYDGVAENTRTAYSRAWRQFESWCEQYGFTAMPCGELTLANYVAHLVVADLAPATIDQAMACILSRHELAHQPKPNTKAARHALRGYKRRLLDDGWRQRKALPILPEQLHAMVAALPRTVAGMRDQFMLVVGWWMMARRSELVALNDVDLRFVKEWIEVYVASSKTDQEARGTVCPLPYGQWADTCPVRVTQQWLDVLSSRGARAAVLRGVDRNGHFRDRLTAQSIDLRVKAAAKAAGLDNPNSYSAHSLRAGGASAAAAAGRSMLAIARHGRWVETSPVVHGYVRAADMWRDNPMRGLGV